MPLEITAAAFISRQAISNKEETLATQVVGECII